MKKSHIFIASFCLCLTTTASAIVQTDTSVQGNFCVGFDCVNDEVFPSTGTTKLKENNTRISWHDVTAGTFQIRENRPNTYLEGEVGQMWRADANESVNGGNNFFYFSQLSVLAVPILSDGTSPDYDCNVFDPELPPPSHPVVGVIPEGEQAESASCIPLEDRVSVEAFTLDGSPTGGVGLGQGAEVESDRIAIGHLMIQKRLVRVAEAINESDALIKSQLDAGLLQDRHATANQIETLLNLAEAEITALEQTVARNDDPVIGLGKGGIGSAGWLLFLLPLIGLRFASRKSHKVQLLDFP